MITKNLNNSSLFDSIEAAAHTVEQKQTKNKIALFYFIKNNNEDEAQLYTASDILIKDTDKDCGILIARIFAIIEKYHHGDMVISLEDMKSVMGRYTADDNFSEESVRFAKEAIKGYEAAVQAGSRIIMLPIETYASALK